MHMAHLVGALLALSVLTANSAAAQIFNPEMMDRSEPASYKSFGLIMPVITATKETVARLEFNLSGQGSISIEGSMKKKREEISASKQEETGESLLAEGKGIAILISRYSSGVDMSGFYWSMGLGMRDERVNWKVAAEESDPQANFALVDEKNQFDHIAVVKGNTGHLRLGYRYVGSQIPIAAGIYLGARHFQAGVEDEKQKDDESNTQVQQDPMTDREKERLKRRVATAPEAGIEFGFSF